MPERYLVRLVLTIVSFCLAVIFIGAGIAGRTIFLQPTSDAQSIEAETEAVYTMVTADVLAQHPGAAQVTVKNPAGPIVIAYGRTDDMLAWIGKADFAEIGLNGSALRVDEFSGAGAGADSNVPVTGSPAGSDLWLTEVSGTDKVMLSAQLPSGYAAIIASDGEQAAPAAISIAWANNVYTPWVGPFFVLGVLFFIAGAVFLWLYWRDNHRRGPRRRTNIPIEAPKQRAIASSKAPKRRELGPAPGRRRFFVSLALLAPLALTACSADYWPTGGSQIAPTPTATAESADGTTTLEPAVTVPQMERILGEISTFTATADAALDGGVLTQRFAGPALTARQANYTIRKTKSDYAAPAAIPAAPLNITLPQQVDNSWPRLVFTVSQDATDSSKPPVALALIQDSPRVNYHVYYAITLVPNAQSPQLAPASVGAPRLPADSKLLKIQPNQLATAYADVLNQDAASQWAAFFLTDGDTLLQQLGKAGQDAIRAQLPANAAINFTASAGSGPALGLATNDAGAVIAVQVDQLRKITPTDGGTVGFAEGSASAALSGFTGKSANGVQSTSGIQLLVYVPAVGSTEPVRILGWTENLIAASEIS